ncbi:hypothetical protein F503_06169 [Ophiostoma piceae UAMH 11346]|uniref:Uncharacterized protein n=1 Tax=Ophiostoma piceae (strain UAMH 11346) TaxID=1262450 RepID=S3CV44_OPHP1|nr:hypothetical protein F503_06169 [Ophiostoma piceae UAMH 11346]
MKFTQTLFTLAAAFGAAQAGWNTTTTVAVTDVVTVPCTTSTGTAASGTGVYVPTSNGTTYSVPAVPTGTGATTVPSTPVTAGAGALDARVFVGAVAAVAAVAFTL